MVTDATIFPDLPKGLAVGSYVSGKDKREYAKLVVRQLRANKVHLALKARAWASVFAVTKSSGAQREVMSGSNVSRCATPPRPPHIANPSVFADIEVARTQRLHLSKRDARCYFDQLQLPHQIRPWFGRPSVTKRDLMTHSDISDEDLGEFAEVFRRMRPSDRAWPICNSWSMGFSWSSFVAQSKLLKCCRSIGLDDTKTLADDLLVPSCSSVTFALAADDVMLFTIGGDAVARPCFESLDKAIADAGIEGVACQVAPGCVCL